MRSKDFVTLKFLSRDSWIYLKRTERRTMKFVIQILREEKSLSAYVLYKKVAKLKGNKDLSDHRLAIKCVLYMLIALGILRVHSLGISRIYKLRRNWQELFDKKVIIRDRDDFFN